MNRIRSDNSMAIFDVCIFFLILLFGESFRADPSYEACVPNQCEKGPSIKFPFFIQGSEQDPHCGLFRIRCSKSGYPGIRVPENDYVIRQIFYESHYFLVYNAAVDNLAANCLSEIRNVTPPAPIMSIASVSRLHLFSRCSKSLSDQLKTYRVACNSGTGDGLELAMLENDENFNSAIQECEINVVAPVELQGHEGRNGVVDYERLLRGGFALNWTTRDCTTCEQSGGRCGINTTTNGVRCFCSYGFEYTVCKSSSSRSSGRKGNLKVVLATVVSAGGIVLLFLLVLYFGKKCKTEKNQDLETFLKNYGSLAPKRYHYSEVKKMTNSFGTKLGQGGYGSVYKGKLNDGSLVAVKVLKESEGNGEEFINEVASISRTSHVNIVTLLGFCVQGGKKALIYEFMANGSLEKFIYREQSSVNRQLEWPTSYRIAVGIARGLEYLHRGCNTRILHFDIKPHNILLDENFCPKISDFGLAKLCTRKESMISTMTARGTIGYIAPEVFCKNIGVVSPKSDVYSYGMMVLEMVGGRKNVDVGVDGRSEIYFPHWIYTRLCHGEELGLSGIKDEGENEQARKMLLVSLWCIQTNPSDRPSMNKVVEMLEGNLEALEMPPKPFLFPSPPASSKRSTTQSCHSAPISPSVS